MKSDSLLQRGSLRVESDDVKLAELTEEPACSGAQFCCPVSWCRFCFDTPSRRRWQDPTSVDIVCFRRPLAPGRATVNARLRMLHLFVVCVGTSLPAWVRATTASSTRSRETRLSSAKVTLLRAVASSCLTAQAQLIPQGCCLRLPGAQSKPA